MTENSAYSRLRQRNPLPTSGKQGMYLKKLINQMKMLIESGNKRARVDPQFDVNIGREMVAKMVVMHELALLFVTYFGFRDLMKYCKTLIGPLSKDYLKK
ncbi:hypothetical protein Patl1_24631 [Pistacia atlantica]|uniref:Uncharacterized protein n=1 Tax=Pistacia atlantica TaxID=434234 RepID=A0ACC0ZYN5_9ROSI|nr:hypothetical protein Patl1_24631 [Pistacia atlantica]